MLSSLEPQCCHLDRKAQRPLRLRTLAGSHGDQTKRGAWRSSVQVPDQSCPGLPQGPASALGHPDRMRGQAASSGRGSQKERTQRAGCKHLFPREMGVAGKLECSLLLSKRTRSSRPKMSRRASYWCDTHLWPPRKTACKYHPRSRPFTRGPGAGVRLHLPRNVLRAGTGCGANDLVSFAEICRMWTELTFLPRAEQKEHLTKMLLFRVSPPSWAGGRLGPPRETPPGVGKISPYRRCEHKWPGPAWLQPPALVHPLAAVRK